MNSRLVVCRTIAAAVLLFMGPSGWACICGAPRSACHGYGQADVIFVGTALKASTRSTVFINHRSYKGSLGERVEILGEGSSCDFRFEIGQTYLIYATRGRFFGRLYTNGCSGTGRLEEKRGDLVYLSRVNSLPPLGTLTGILMQAVYDIPEGREESVPMPRIEIRIKGNDSEFVSHTNLQGEFSAKDLEPGMYSVVPIVPDTFFLEPQAIKVVARACTDVWLRTGPDGHLRGTVRDSQGRPVAGKSVSSFLVDKPPNRYLFLFKSYATTDSSGRFDIGPLPAGRFLLGLNLEFQPDSEDPHLPVFFSGGTGPMQAQIIELKEGETLDDLDLRLPQPLKGRKFTFKAVWPDGHFADKFSVSTFTPEFDWIESRHFGVESLDRLDLVLFEGVRYWVGGSTTDPQEQYWCSEVIQISPEERPHTIVLKLQRSPEDCLWQQSRQKGKTLYDYFH